MTPPPRTTPTTTTVIPNSSPSEEDLTAEIVEQDGEDGERYELERGQQIKASRNLKENLEKARTLDIRVQIALRILTTIFFYALLIIQNYWVFKLVTDVLVSNINNPNVIYLEPILAIIVPSTLAETYYITVKIVDWVLKPIDYNV
ncbi:MAG: hypothetical protein AAB553_05285 [Patescibacteria group bacterium]